MKRSTRNSRSKMLQKSSAPIWSSSISSALQLPEDGMLNTALLSADINERNSGLLDTLNAEALSTNWQTQSSQIGTPLLPTLAAERKNLPLARGLLDYFPLALTEVSRVSRAGSIQHHPSEPIHWDKTKSTDHADCIMRHLLERGTVDTDGMRHSAKMAWRALALLQIELENLAKLNTPLDQSVF